MTHGKGENTLMEIIIIGAILNAISEGMFDDERYLPLHVVQDALRKMGIKEEDPLLDAEIERWLKAKRCKDCGELARQVMQEGSTPVLYCPQCAHDHLHHPTHLKKNLYWGGCHLCDQENERYEAKPKTMTITHIAPRTDSEGYFDSIRGIVEGATNQQDLQVWDIDMHALSRFLGQRITKRPTIDETLRAAHFLIACNPLARNAEWITEQEMQAKIEALAPARRGQAYVNFGTSDDDREAEYYGLSY
jgi:hypothetical protein